MGSGTGAGIAVGIGDVVGSGNGVGIAVGLGVVVGLVVGVGMDVGAWVGVGKFAVGLGAAIGIGVGVEVEPSAWASVGCSSLSGCPAHATTSDVEIIVANSVGTAALEKNTAKSTLKYYSHLEQTGKVVPGPQLG